MGKRMDQQHSHHPEFLLEDESGDLVEFSSRDQEQQHNIAASQLETATGYATQQQTDEELLYAQQSEKLTTLVDEVNQSKAAIAAERQADTLVHRANKYFRDGLRLARQQQHYPAACHFFKAASLGHGKAQMFLGVLYVHGDGVPASLLHAYSWLTLAMSQNIKTAHSALEQLEKILTEEQKSRATEHAANTFEAIQRLYNN